MNGRAKSTERKGRKGNVVGGIEREKRKVMGRTEERGLEREGKGKGREAYDWKGIVKKLRTKNGRRRVRDRRK